MSFIYWIQICIGGIFMVKHFKTIITIGLCILLLSQSFVPIVFADAKDAQKISGLQTTFEYRDKETDIIIEFIEYLSEQLDYEIVVPPDYHLRISNLLNNPALYQIKNADINELEAIINIPALRQMSWEELGYKYRSASVYDKLILYRPIDYSTNKYDFEIYRRLIWLLENKQLDDQLIEDIELAIYYIISTEYNIALSAMSDAETLVNYKPSSSAQLKLKQVNSHWKAAMEQLKTGNTLPLMFHLQLTNLRAHDVLKEYGLDYTYESSEIDSDGDNITDLMELITNSNPYNSDTDGDFLPDDYEFKYHISSNIKFDTNGDSISDADEDYDQDGLSNLKEFQIGTDPTEKDTDGDGLDDYEEVMIYGTDPLNSDTDMDLVGDGREIELGLDPLKKDSNGNGIIDGEEKFIQVIPLHQEIRDIYEEIGLIPEITFHGPAVEPYRVYIRNPHNLWKSLDDTRGLIGRGVQIESNEPFDQVTISFNLKPKALHGIPIENVRIVWFDAEKYRFELVPNQTIDRDHSKISATIDRLGIYMVIHWGSNKSFKDIEGHWAEKIINRIGDVGIINGYPDGTFKPNQSVQADEFVKKLVMTVKGYIEPAKEGYWAQPFIDQAAALMIVNKDTDLVNGKLNYPLTREKAAQFIYKALQPVEEDEDLEFAALSEQMIKDIQMNEVYKKGEFPHEIYQVYAKGIMQGNEKGEFNFDKTLTRAEALALILRLADDSERLPYNPSK